MNKVFCSLAFFIAGISSYGQSYIFGLTNSTPVSVNGQNLVNPWAGGLNAVQVQKMDLNNDSVEDLVLFDKINSKVSTYLASGNTYFHAPEYEFFFPNMTSWFVLADYNNDGKKDIFTCGYYASTVKIYKNVSDSLPKWKIAADTISAIGSTDYPFNINVSLSNYPSILDIDNDGDVDIFTYNALSGSGIEFYKNNSIENFGISDSIVYEKYMSCWGKFTIGYDCNNLIQLNQSCFNNGGTHDVREMHNGSTITLLDLNGDGLQDLLLGDVGCNNITALTNTGTNLIGNVSFVQSNYPASKPVNITAFPATYYEDIDFDGNKDLIASPNQYINDDNASDFTNSIWLYKNTGTSTIPTFSFIKTNFLQETMIDLGENAFPALADYDGDGDLDLFVGNRGTIHGSTFYATISLFKNIGTIDSAAFTFIDSDIFNLSQLNVTSIRPGFLDLDNNGTIDIYFLVNESNGDSHIYYMLNSSAVNNTFSFDLDNKMEFVINPPNNPPGNYDNASAFIQESNSLPGILLGRDNGIIQMFRNSGTATSPELALQATSVAGTAYDDYKTSPMPLLTHLNNADTLELLTIDDTGELDIYVYKSATNTIPATGTLVKKTVYSALNLQNNTTKFGRTCGLTTGDLNNDGYKEIIVGTAGGGLMLLKNLRKEAPVIIPDPVSTIPGTTVPGIDPGNTLTGTNPPSTTITPSLADAGIVILHPNPVNDVLTIFTKLSAQAILMNAQGTLIGGEITLPEEHASQLNVNNLKPGIYFLKIFNHNSTLVKKVIIF